MQRRSTVQRHEGLYKKRASVYRDLNLTRAADSGTLLQVTCSGATLLGNDCRA